MKFQVGSARHPKSDPKSFVRRSIIWSSAALGTTLVIGCWAVLATSQTKKESSPAPAKISGPQTKNPGAWPYADSYDEVTAAGDAYHVRFEDKHIRLVEVSIFPGEHVVMEGDPYASISAMDAPMPANVVDVPLDPNSPLNGQGAGHAPPPQGLQYPTCTTMKPLAPHSITNNDSYPIHYFRIEYKRIDGEGIKTHWKQWYPWMLAPLKTVTNMDPTDPDLGPPVSKDYPFPAATESYIAAPNSHTVLYQDDHLIVMEVAARPGQRENLHGHENPSVFFRDSAASPAQDGRKPPKHQAVQPTNIDPGVHVVRNVEPVNDNGGNYQRFPDGKNGEDSGVAPAPEGMMYPYCSTMGVQWPHAGNTVVPYALHFYRIQFKRVDGDGIKTHWKEWYPWMSKLAYDYKKAHPATH